MKITVYIFLFTYAWCHSVVFAEGLDDQVRAAIKELQDRLILAQQEDGSWIENQGKTDDYVGATAVALMALVRSGKNIKEDYIVNGMEYLNAHVSKRVAYNEGFAATAIEMIDKDRKYKDRIKQAIQALVNAQHKTEGHWGYNTETKGSGKYDNSTTQIAILGLGAGIRYGFTIPPSVLTLAINHWKTVQNPDGSWQYNTTKEPTLQMTCAGIASLFLLGEKEEEVLPICGEYEPNKYIKAGFKWLDDYITANPNPYSGGHASYAMYALERVALYLDKKEIAGQDWYRSGVEIILNKYRSAKKVTDLSFYLLFLAKGFTPIAIAKWKYEGEWDNHHYDMKGWMEVVEKDLGRKLDWMAFDLNSLESPAAKASMIYANGLKKFKMNENEAAFIRSFLDMNGTVVFENCYSSPEFIRSVIDELSTKLFPGQSINFQPIQEGHPVLTAKHTISHEDISALQLNVGCKKIRIIILSRNFSCSLNGEKGHPEDDSRSRKVAVNLLAWSLQSKDATRRLDNIELKEVDSLTFDMSPDQKIKAAPGYALPAHEPIARLMHNGDWNVDEHFFDTLQALISQNNALPFRPHEAIMKADSPDLLRTAMAFMIGHDDPKLSKKEVDNLRHYLNNGGFLIASACCSEPAFQKGFQKLVVDLFPRDRLEKIPENDLIRTSPLDTRSFQPSGTQAYINKFNRNWSDLYGIRRNGRWILIYSPIDISCALEGDTNDKKESYDKKSAFALWCNMTHYALQP